MEKNSDKEVRRKIQKANEMSMVYLFGLFGIIGLQVVTLYLSSCLTKSTSTLVLTFGAIVLGFLLGVSRNLTFTLSQRL